MLGDLRSHRDEASMHLRSKVSSDGRIVVPRAVAKGLNLRPGDYVRFIVEARSVRFLIETPQDAENPFATFSEWARKPDEEAMPTSSSAAKWFFHDSALA